LAKPERVTPGLTAPSTSPAGRSLEEAIGGMISPAPKVTADEPSREVASLDSAQRLAGFQPHLIGARTDRTDLAVTGAYVVDMPIDPAQLRTILDEAGRKDVSAPSSLRGTALHIGIARGVRVQYGACPRPTDNTIQGQLAGPPPPSTEYGSCLTLTETPPATIASPAGLDLSSLLEIALELAGMSPTQTRAFQQRLDPAGTLVVSLPRFMRSYDSVSIGASPGMLLTTAGRRGPTYALVWPRGGLVYVLSGYGNPGDAVKIADTVR
jgi:hypothetical protein